MSRSDAIRSALLAAAGRLRQRQELAAEVAALEADEQDRQEMPDVAGFMGALRAAGSRRPLPPPTWTSSRTAPRPLRRRTASERVPTPIRRHRRSHVTE